MSENSVSADLDPILREIVHTAQSNTATENEFGYYGWRVVLAACLGVMAGFGSLFVYTFSVFVKPLATQFDGREKKSQQASPLRPSHSA